MSGRMENEMSQIHKGLEDFLERELQIYTLEEEQKQEKELDIIGSTKSRQNAANRNNTQNNRNAASHSSIQNRQNATNHSSTQNRQRSREYQFYEEDWDREDDRRPERKESSRRSQSTNSKRSQSVNSKSPTQKKQSESEGKQSYRTDKKESGDKRSHRTDREKSDTGNQTAEKSKRKAPRKDRKQKKWKSRLKRFLLIAAVVLLLLGIGLYQLVGVVYSKLNYQEIVSFSDQPLQKDGVVNILLIGNDSRENGDDGRSDAMILLSISKKTKTIYMTSLLRDMYVEIPGRNGNRLNAAYSFGGAELLMETIEQNFDIPVNRCVQVNFEAFANLVDAVDGVDLELSTEEIEYVNGYLVEYNMLTGRPQGTDNMDTSASGMVHLNGPQALAYCRIRYLGTDFGRTERQRKVLTEVIKKIPGTMVTNGSELFEGLMPNLTTNLTRMECFRLSLMAGRFITYDIVSDSIPQTGTYKNASIRGMSVLEVDFDANKKYLREKLYGEKSQ